jgi:acyl-CoA synthetase (NDP forming)
LTGLAPVKPSGVPYALPADGTTLTIRPAGREDYEAVVQEPVSGPVVVSGLSGAAANMLADHAARLVSLTSPDAEELVRSICMARTLLGRDGQHAVGIGARRDVLLRLPWLADDLPQVAGLDLNSVMVRPGGAVAVDVRVRVTGRRLAGPFVRRLAPMTDCIDHEEGP